MILPSLACIAFARAAPSTVAPTALGVVITLAEPGEAIAASIAGAAPLPTCPDIRRGYDQAGATGGGGPSLPAGNTTLDECCGTCASRVGVCDGWVYDPAGKQCWLLSGCKGYARSPKRIMGLIPNSPTRAPTVPRPTPAPTGGARLVAEVGSASSFRLGVRFGSPIDLDPIATPSLDPARTVAAFQRVTSWEDVDGTFAGVSTAFGALLIDTATGSWKLVDAANSTVVRGDAPALDHAFAQGRVDLAVHGSAGPPAEQVGPFNHRNNPCLSNGAMGSPHYFDAEAKLWAFIVSPWDHDPNLDAVSDGAYPQCYPVSISGVPPTKAPSACADALPGRDAAGGNICRDQPAPSIATQAACCAACDASVDCEVWRFDRTPAAAQPCTLLFGVSSTVAAKDTVIGGSGVAPPPAPPAGESSTVWTALGYAADVYLAPLAAAPASAAEGAAPARSAASASIGDDAAAALYDLTGYPNMPPLYAFGFMACYWGWLNADDVTSNMTAFRTGKFPIDSFIMDYDWFNCGTSGGACADKGTDFGYSVETFPHPVQQLSEFHTKWHMKFAGIRKPRTYDHLALANKSGWLLEFSGAGVQGDNNFNYSHPDMRAWYAKNSEHFVSDGIDFWWNDEGETQWFTYHWWNAAQKAEALAVLPHRRIWSINRAYTPGMQRFPAIIWSGDRSDCSHATALLFSRQGATHMTCDMQDGGDDAHATSAGADFLVRQYQNAATLPFMRVHKMHGVPRFPWNWGNASHLAAFRAALDLRYRLIPFIYSLAHRANRRGVPIARPASHAFPPEAAGGEKAVAKSGAEPYLLGDSMIPCDWDRIERLSSDANAASFVLPAGPDANAPLLWYAFGDARNPMVGNNTKVHSGNVNISTHPIFVRAGAIVPLQNAAAKVQRTGEMGGALDVHIYGGHDATFQMVEDDGATDAAVTRGAAATRTTTWSWSDATKTLSWSVAGEYGSAALANTTQLYTSATLMLFEAAGAQSAAVPALGAKGSHTFSSAY